MWPRSPSAGERDRSSCVATRSECRRTEPELLCGCEVRGPENGPDRRRLLTLSFFPSLRAAGKIICRTIIRDRKAPDDFFAGGGDTIRPVASVASVASVPSVASVASVPSVPSVLSVLPVLSVPSRSLPFPSRSLSFLPVSSRRIRSSASLTPPLRFHTKKACVSAGSFPACAEQILLFIAVARSGYASQHRGSSYHPT